jgi:hypothetical protein
LKISINETEILPFKRKYPARTKIAVEDKTLEQVTDFRYLGYDAIFQQETDTEVEIQKLEDHLEEKSERNIR